MDDTPTDNSPADNNPSSNNASNNNPSSDDPAIGSSAPNDNTSTDTPRLATIPEELSFDNLSDNDRDRKCHVEVRCHGRGDDGDDDDDDDDDGDHGHHGRPSYCSKHCSYDEAKHKAKEMCRHKCHNVDCHHMRDKGRCHGGHESDASPSVSPI